LKHKKRSKLDLKK